LICKAIEESANQEAIKQARRFNFGYRYSIYRAAAQSRRALQITDVFPVLALAIYHGDGRDRPWRESAAALVEAGAPLKNIAACTGIPMAFPEVKPGAADSALFAHVHRQWDRKLIYAFLPNSLRSMETWLIAMNFASQFGPDFVEWVAKNCQKIAATRNETFASLEDIADWVRACDPARVTHDMQGVHGVDDAMGAQFVVRPFSPDMSPQTVARLSADWHEAVASNMSGPSYLFPEPWCDAGLVHEYKIVPITNSADLYREGRTMHHCVGSYGDRVRQGETYIYSVRKDEERIATVELGTHRGQVWIGQLRGPCNSQVSKEIEQAVSIWLRLQKNFRLPARVQADDLDQKNPRLPARAEAYEFDETPF
jgi:hypothetical protein